MNTLRNAVYLVVMLMFSIILCITFSIAQQIIDGVKADTPTDLSYFENTYNLLETLKTLFTGLTHFILAMAVMIMFLSSAIERNSIMSYTLNFIVSIFASVVLIYVSSMVLTAFTTSGVAWLDFTMIPSWFTANYTYLFIINILAGLSSFVFVKIQTQREAK